DLAPVDDGADQLGVERLLPVGSLRRGGQAEPKGGQAADGGSLVTGPGQMMALVEDQQTEAVSPAFEVQVGGIVGGHRERLKFVVAAAEQTDGAAERLQELGVP